MTKASPELKPLPGLTKPKNTANWFFQKKTPKDLQEHPAWRGKVFAYRESLGTPDLREANAKAAQVLADLEATWKVQRAAQQVTPVEALTEPMRAAIAQQLKARMLAADEAQRSDPVALAQSLAVWWQGREEGRRLSHEREHQEPYRGPTMPRIISPHGLDEVRARVEAGQAEVLLYQLLPLLQERNEAAARAARESLARGGSGSFILQAEAAALSLGINIATADWTKPQGKPLRDACHRAFVEVLEAIAARASGDMVPTPQAPVLEPQGASETEEVKTLGVVVSEVVKAQADNGFKRKVKGVTALLVEYLGEGLPVTKLKQAHIDSFLSEICRLPVDWYDRQQKGATLRDLLAEDHAKCISVTTFDQTYRAGLGLFLKRAANSYGDQGFPRHLGVAFADYKGSREEKEDKQRNFKPVELRRLFESPAFQALAQAPDQQHRYWLPLLALYTGARPRELCQLNPQCDYGTQGGLPFLLISETTEADEGVVKTVKTGEERHVPIHPELVRLGFLSYLDRIKAQGAKRLFPAFGMNKGDAAYRAKEWFSQFLGELGLRDETPKQRLTGLYAFRKTFITTASHLGLRFEPITGHAEEGRSKVVRSSYITEELPLAQKLEVLEQITFAIQPPRAPR